MIDVHSHILNFGCCPDEWLTKLTYIPHVEQILKLPMSKRIIQLLTFLLHRGKFSKTHEMIDIFNAMLFDVGEILRQESEEAGIKLTTPLMMDMDQATDKLFKSELNYGIQIEIMKRIAKKHYGTIMPFIGYDPRRQDANKIVVFSLMAKGMLGIKMYPKLGFHPSPQSIVNSFDVNGKLDDMYEYCVTNSIPITTHCSPGGAYSEGLIGKREERNTLVHPSAWEEVLKRHPTLYLNLGHFGGNWKWAEHAIKLMEAYPNVYGDISYHDLAHKDPDAYFKVFNSSKMPHDRLMFGSDWSMIRHTYTIKEFMKPFKENIKSRVRNKIFYENALNFLFPENKIPDRIRLALDMGDDDTPVWLQTQFKRRETK